MNSPTSDRDLHIVIVGAGFSGTALAVQLLRRHGRQPLHISLINRHPDLGRGVAYGTHSPHHQLNVPAGRMSMFPDEPDDFLRYARDDDPAIGGGDFVPRSLYGRYLAARLHEAVHAAHRARFQSLTGEAVDFRPAEGRACGRLELKSGVLLAADRLVLTTGNYAPADPPVPEAEFFESPWYVRDPWRRGAFSRLDPVAPALLIGTGLTAADVALDLKRRGVTGKITALSRRGLLPQAHRHQDGPPLPAAAVVDRLRAGPANIRHYLRVLREAIADLEAAGSDWRDGVGALRPATAELWQALNLGERRRFLRHLQPYWDTHRHRMAPSAAEQLTQLIRSGQLAMAAGRLVRLRESGVGKVEIVWRPRGSRDDVLLEAGAVINCTGPQSRLERIDDRLLQSLLKQGLMRADPLGLGVETDADDALVDAEGRGSRLIYYTGPLLRARYWECTAVPELRAAAARLADRLAAGV